MQLRGKNVLVLGLGQTGISMVRWLVSQGARVRVADTRPEPPQRERLAREDAGIPLDAGPFRAESFAAADLVAISPGVPLAEPNVRSAMARGVPVVGDIELFAWARDPAADVIAITGSNGKSTVTTMVGAMCRSAGASVVVAGNIGLPVLDALEQQRSPRVFVLELSSFQLETTYSLNAHVAAVLNLCEDHLDRYAGMQEYAAAKSRIFIGCKAQVLNRDDAWSYGMRDAERAMTSFGSGPPTRETDWGLIEAGAQSWLAQGDRRLMPVSDLGVPGTHNALNALAALALCRCVDLPLPPLLEALRRFNGLPHRMQVVAEIHGVSFLDDSKGTNVGATVAALAGLKRKSVLIAGGDGKGQDFAPLAEPVKRHARCVVLIGRDRELIARALGESQVPIVRALSLDEAVEIAYAAAEPGDAVLLSPACASFDMFRDYRHRGEEFARIARALAGRIGGRH